MTVPSSSPTTFDTTLASTLFPSIVALSYASALIQSPNDSSASTVNNNNEVAIASAKLELGKQATQLRNALNTLKLQAENLEMGDLSVQDQAWIIEQLQEKVREKRSEVEMLKNLIPKKNDESQEAKQARDAGEEMDISG